MIDREEKKLKVRRRIVMAILIAFVAFMIWDWYPPRKVRSLVEESTHGPSYDDYFYFGRSSAEIQGDMKLLGDFAVGPLIELLKDPDASIRRQAARFLKECKASRAVPSLMEVVHDPDHLVRQAAVDALGAIGDPNAVTVIIHCMDDDNGEVRFAAAISLGKLGDSNAVTPLLNALQDRDVYVRAYAAESLGEFRDKRIQPALRRILEGVDDWVVNEATWSLLKLGDDSCKPGIIDEIESPGGTDGWKIAKIKMLGDIGNPLAKELLERFKVTVKSEVVQKAIAASLEKINVVNRKQ